MTTNEDTAGTPKRGRKTKTAEAVPPPPPETTEATEAVTDGAEAADAQPTSDATADTVPAETASTDAAAPQPSFADAIADAQANDTSLWEWDEAEEVIPVKLTDADAHRMLSANGADEEAKDAVDREIDRLKETLKTKKAESETIAARIKERNKLGAKGIEQRRDTYKIGTCFALNTVRYVDRVTGETVYERPLEAHERQQSLKLVPEAAPDNVVQLHFGDVEPTDATDVTSPESLLADAERGAAVAEPDEDLDDEGGAQDDEDDEDL